jgi:hypothetical protein
MLVHHFLGGSLIQVSSRRAIAQTKMSIAQRLALGDVEVDVTCVGPFYDFFEQRDGDWRIVLREPIYEKDRVDAVVPGQIPPVDQAVLETFPSGCRHLLYCQTTAGMNIHTDVPGLRGREVQELYATVGAGWPAKPSPAEGHPCVDLVGSSVDMPSSLSGSLKRMDTCIVQVCCIWVINSPLGHTR